MIGLAVGALIRPKRRSDALAKQALMGFDHRAYRGFVFYPTRRTCPYQEEIPATPTELKGAPTRKPVCGLPLVDAAHGLGVEGQGLLWHDHSTTQEARHMEKMG